jgi:hypothetical protein
MGKLAGRPGSIVPDHGRPSISGPIRSIKMYSWARCTVQKRLLCSGDVPCLAQEEQGPGPLGPRWTGSYHAKEGFQVSERGVGLKQ